METAVRQTPIDVRGRLAELGLSEELLLEAVKAGQAARDTCTANDPPGLPGSLAWGRTTRTLRELLAPDGWLRSDAENFSIVVSPSGAFAIAVATGDDGTGVADKPASTKYPKGPATARAIDRNKDQIEMFPNLVPEAPRLTPGDSRLVTWLLLIRRHGDRVFAELSLPFSVNDSGFVEQWSERIILTLITLDGEPNRVPEELTDEIDVSVVRR